MTGKFPGKASAGGGSALPLQLEALQSALIGQRLGGKFHYFVEIDSTNTRARQLAENGAREGEIVVAEQQTRGRGRLGRNWISPPFVNLYLSIVLRPELQPVHAPQITLMAAVALADTVARFSIEPPAIKWPNDILVQGRKLAGILTESSVTAERINYVILGIGVNVNYACALMPEAIRGHATSLMECAGHIVSREAFLGRLIQDLDRCYGILGEAGFDRIAQRWESYFSLRGKPVRVETGDGAVAGIAKGIDKDGALLIEGERGQFHRIVAGDVVPLIC
jgi:BirA family biotin operon repressor/biotin-[acetyl-CoA-carboxylase] ligase